MIVLIHILFVLKKQKYSHEAFYQFQGQSIDLPLFSLHQELSSVFFYLLKLIFGMWIMESMAMMFMKIIGVKILNNERVSWYINQSDPYFGVSGGLLWSVEEGRFSNFPSSKQSSFMIFYKVLYFFSIFWWWDRHLWLSLPLSSSLDIKMKNLLDRRSLWA